MKAFLRSTRFAILAASTVMGFPAYAAGPGTDTFGNRITSSDFDMSIPTGLFLDITGTGTIITSGDDVSSGFVNLGFAFPFYGTTYTSLNFTSNGYISTDPTDAGPDLTNDPTLPTPPSTGGGGRIYPYHDDLITTVYGQQFSASQSMWGTEMYVAQWIGTHWSGGGTLNFNTFLLRDGTIIFAYDDVSFEAGSGGTVGIQNPGATDGVAYLANEMALSPGMTILILSPTSISPFSGIGNDLNITANTLGAIQTREQASAIGSAVSTAFSRAEGEFVSTASVQRQSSADPLGVSAWAMIQGTAIDGNVGGSVSGSNFAFRAGFDRPFGTGFLGGVAFSYARGSLGIGAMKTTGDFYTVEPYVAARFASNWTATASISYTRSEYDRISTPMLTASASGDRIAGSLAVEGRFFLPDANVTLVPQFIVTGGHENISNWSAGGLGGATPSANFYMIEATLKAERQISMPDGANGKAYLLAGVDFTNSNGDGRTALFATNFSDDRFGGVAGAGLELAVSDTVHFRGEVKGTGLGSDVYTVSASAMLSKSF